MSPPWPVALRAILPCWGHVGSKLQLSHSFRSQAVEDSKRKSCHRKQATATVDKTEKAHSFEESVCRNWIEKGWRRQRRSCRKQDMPCDTSVHLTFISLQQRHRGDAAITESSVPITSSQIHLYSTDLLTQGRGKAAHRCWPLKSYSAGYPLF